MNDTVLACAEQAPSGKYFPDPIREHHARMLAASRRRLADEFDRLIRPPIPSWRPCAAELTALWLMNAGLWPVVITPYDDNHKNAGKAPILRNWGLERPTRHFLRAMFYRWPRAGVGLRLGALGGVVDLDVDKPDLAASVIARMFPLGLPPTIGWQSTRGAHLLFAWDDRLAAYITPDSTIVQGGMYAGIELRLGPPSWDPRQVQSVAPPSPGTNGTPRRWNDGKWLLPLPESVYEDLERYARKPEHPQPEHTGRSRQSGSTEAAACPPRIPDSLVFGECTKALLKRAKKYVDACEPAVDHTDGKGDRRTYRIACWLRDRGVPPEAALRLLLTLYNPRCRPPWTERELRHKVEYAYRGGSTS